MNGSVNVMSFMSECSCSGAQFGCCGQFQLCQWSLKQWPCRPFYQFHSCWSCLPWFLWSKDFYVFQCNRFLWRKWSRLYFYIHNILVLMTLCAWWEQSNTPMISFSCVSKLCKLSTTKGRPPWKGKQHIRLGLLPISILMLSGRGGYLPLG